MSKKSLPAKTVKTLKIIGVAFFIAVLLIVLLYRTYLNFRLKWQLSSWEKQAETRQQAQQDRFEQLLAKQRDPDRNPDETKSSQRANVQNVQNDQNEPDKQKSAGSTPESATSNNTANDPTLLGSQQVLILITKRPQLPAAALQPLITALRNPNKTQPESIQYINHFIQQQKQRYTKQNLELNIQLDNQLHNLPELTAVGDMSNPWGKDMFGMSKLQDQFEDILAKTHPEVDKNQPVIFLYFDDQLLESGSGNFYDSKKFRSFAHESQQRAFVNVYSLRPEFASTLTEIITHELLHLYGTRDKYVEDDRNCKHNGWGDLSLSVASLQPTGDIMCGYVITSEGLALGSFDERNLVINRETAAELGWIE